MKLLKIFLIFVSLLFPIYYSLGQTVTNIYLFPGQGSDKRIFDSLRFDKPYNLHFVEYGTPRKNQSMQSFAIELARQIDTTEEFMLIGVSLGGMICAELADILHPKKVILISSVKNRNELPFRYRFQKTIPLYKLVPAALMLWGAKLLQPIVEPDRNRNKETFVAMLESKNAIYMKRSVGMIINWNKKNSNPLIIQILGSNDHTLPIKNVIKPQFIVKDGSHMMTLTRAEEINLILNEILSD
jgi:pimeloyl-ACP methyl ester carboxylesterase